MSVTENRGPNGEQKFMRCGPKGQRLFAAELLSLCTYKEKRQCVGSYFYGWVAY